jgi:hypothetical protein
LEDIIRMIKTNISKDKIKFENLHKSFFNDLNTTCSIADQKVAITNIDVENQDPASVELEIIVDKFYISFWDGYSLAERFDFVSYEQALTQFKKSAKKLAKNLRRF